MNNLFDIISKSNTAESTYTYVVKLNKQHRVFEGHFPGNPIVPGVMSMMMIRMLVEDVIGRKTRFTAVKDCKYLQPIVPSDEPLTINFNTDGTAVNAEIVTSEGVGLMKIKGTIA